MRRPGSPSGAPRCAFREYLPYLVVADLREVAVRLPDRGEVLREPCAHHPIRPESAAAGRAAPLIQVNTPRLDD